MSTSSTISGNQRPQAELLGSPDYSSTAPPARSTGGGVEQMSTAPAAQTDLEKHYCEACSAAGLVPRDWVCAVLASVPASLWSTADSADLVGGNIPTGAILQLKPPMPGDALQPEELSVLLSMLTRYEFLRILLLELSGNQVDREACENVVYLIGMSFATYTPANIRLADCGFTSGGFNLLRLSSKQYHLQRLDLCHNREWRTGNKEHWRALLENKDEQLRLLCVQYTGLTNADLCTMLRAIAEHLELRDSQSFHLKLGPPAVNSTAAEHFSDASMQELLALVQKLCGLRVLEALDIWGLTEAQRHLLEQHWAGVEGRAPTVVLGQGNLAHFTTQSGRSDCEVWPTEHVLPDAPPTPPQPASSTSSMHRPGSGADHPAACDVMDGGVRLDRVGQRDAQPIPYHPDPAAALRRQAQENQFAASNAGGVDSAVRKRVQQTVATKASAGYFRPNSVLHLVGPAPYQHQLTSPGLHQRHSQPDQPARRRRRPANQSGGGHHQEGLPRAQPDVPEERGDVDMQAYKGQKYRAGSQGRPHGPGDASHRPTLLSSHRLGTGIGDREIGISTADPDDDWQSPPPEDVRQRRKLQGKRKQPSRDPAPVMPGASLGATPPGAPSSEEEERSMHVRSLTPSGSGSESGPGLSNAQSNSAEAGFMVSSQVAPDELQYGKEAEIEKQLAAERGGASSTEEDDEDGPANLVAFPRCLMADKFPAKGPFAAPLHNKRVRQAPPARAKAAEQLRQKQEANKRRREGCATEEHDADARMADQAAEDSQSPALASPLSELAGRAPAGRKPGSASFVDISAGGGHESMRVDYSPAPPTQRLHSKQQHANSRGSADESEHDDAAGSAAAGLRQTRHRAIAVSVGASSPESSLRKQPRQTRIADWEEDDSPVAQQPHPHCVPSAAENAASVGIATSLHSSPQAQLHGAEARLPASSSPTAFSSAPEQRRRDKGNKPKRRKHSRRRAAEQANAQPEAGLLEAWGVQQQQLGRANTAASEPALAQPVLQDQTRVSKEVQMLQAFAYDPNRHKYPPNLDKMHLGVTEGRRARRCPQRYSPEAPGHNHDVEQVPMAEVESPPASSSGTSNTGSLSEDDMPLAKLAHARSHTPRLSAQPVTGPAAPDTQSAGGGATGEDGGWGSTCSMQPQRAAVMTTASPTSSAAPLPMSPAKVAAAQEDCRSPAHTGSIPAAVRHPRSTSTLPMTLFALANEGQGQAVVQEAASTQHINAASQAGGAGAAVTLPKPQLWSLDSAPVAMQESSPPASALPPAAAPNIAHLVLGLADVQLEQGDQVDKGAANALPTEQITATSCGDRPAPLPPSACSPVLPPSAAAAEQQPVAGTEAVVRATPPGAAPAAVAPASAERAYADGNVAGVMPSVSSSAQAVGSLCAGFSKVLQAGIASPPSQARAAACPPAGSSAALAMDVEEFELVIPDSQEQDDL